MIVFRTIRYKNFLSTGNVFTTIELDKNDRTLVCGDNGAGKTTMLDALTFGLFGRPFRNVNLNQLVNSVNGKNCVVEIEFDIGEKSYKVVRGIMPKKFEIFRDGTMLEQESKSKDYQRLLEDQILRLNYKSFCQVVILGSTNYVPFMRLPSTDRRNIVETLLDINIFSSMNLVLKERQSAIRSQIDAEDAALNTLQSQITITEKFIHQLEEQSKASLMAIQEAMAAAGREAESMQKEIDVLLSERPQKIDVSKRRSTLARIDSLVVQMGRKVVNAKGQVKFFSENETCPVCDQPLSSDHRQHHIDSYQAKIAEYEKAMSDLRNNRSVESDKMKSEESTNAAIDQIDSAIRSLQAKMAAHRQTETRLSKQASEFSNGSIDLQKERDQLAEYRMAKDQAAAKKAAMLEERQYTEIASMLLRDGGIKSQIIKHHLPVMNRLINQYLAALDFYVQFTLDEEFRETIKSRHRDEFTYASFSEGEKLRIDLSLLLAWREIARLKNSVNCNLLILDEVFDSSLDAVGTEEFMKLLQSMNGSQTNVFVISHKSDQLVDRFSSVIRFRKQNGFSMVEET